MRSVPLDLFHKDGPHSRNEPNLIRGHGQKPLGRIDPAHKKCLYCPITEATICKPQVPVRFVCLLQVVSPKLLGPQYGVASITGRLHSSALTAASRRSTTSNPNNRVVVPHLVRFGRTRTAQTECPLWVKSGHVQRTSRCPLSAKSGHRLGYSMTSSARPISVFGTLRPRALAVLRLMVSSTLVTCWTGKIGGLLALEDAASVEASLPVRVPDIAAVTQQSAGHDEIAHRMDSRHSVLERQSGKLLCAAIEKNVGRDNEPANVQLGQLQRTRIRFRARCWRS